MTDAPKLIALQLPAFFEMQTAAPSARHGFAQFLKGSIGYQPLLNMSAMLTAERDIREAAEPIQ